MESKSSKADHPPALPRWTNTATRAAVVLVPLAAVGVPLVWMAWVRSPLITGKGLVVQQPLLQFDHRHHVQDQDIPCTYCHVDADRGRTAGYPATEVCAGCHAQVWRHAERLAPVREHAMAAAPMRWVRVTDLPDFVYFDHRAHIVVGLACEECHGQVEAMPVVVKARTLTMGDCLSCHRSEHWDEVAGVQPPLYCSGCHR